MNKNKFEKTWRWKFYESWNKLVHDECSWKRAIGFVVEFNENHLGVGGLTVVTGVDGSAVVFGAVAVFEVAAAADMVVKYKVVASLTWQESNRND